MKPSCFISGTFDFLAMQSDPDEASLKLNNAYFLTISCMEIDLHKNLKISLILRCLFLLIWSCRRLGNYRVFHGWWQLVTNRKNASDPRMATCCTPVVKLLSVHLLRLLARVSFWGLLQMTLLYVDFYRQWLLRLQNNMKRGTLSKASMSPVCSRKRYLQC